MLIGKTKSVIPVLAVWPLREACPFSRICNLSTAYDLQSDRYEYEDLQSDKNGHNLFLFLSLRGVSRITNADTRGSRITNSCERHFGEGPQFSICIILHISMFSLTVFVFGWSEPNTRSKMSNAFSKYSHALS